MASGFSPTRSQVLKKQGVGVAHNPESNMKLASGTAPVARVPQRGVALGLGTDGAASNNDLDMFEAMRQAAFLHKLAVEGPARRQRADGTRHGHPGGARVDRPRTSELGSLEAGKLADVLVVRMDQPRQTPMYRSRFSPRLHDTRRRRGHDHREWPGADAGRESADAERGPGRSPLPRRRRHKSGRPWEYARCFPCRMPM